MISRLELSIAWRYLRSRRGSRLLSFITVIAMGGVIVGVSALIVIMGVMNGLQTDLREKILVGSPDIRILNFGDELRINDWRATVDRVRAMPGVVAAAPFVLTEGLANVVGKSYSGGVSIVGIDPVGAPGPEVTSIRTKATMGDFRFESADGKSMGIVIGALLADRFSAYPGATLSIITPTSVTMDPITGLMMPHAIEFEVTGVFETGMYEYDNQYVFVDLGAGQRAAHLGSAVTGIEVRATDRWVAPALALAIADSLGYPYRTIDWQQQNLALFRALKLEKLGMAVILGLITLVAAFNIVGTLTMVVRDKQREIGILKAMGFKSASVRRVFMLQGAVIGSVGTTIGLALGLGIGLALGRWRLIPLDPAIYFIDHLPVRMEMLDIMAIAIASVAVAILATLHPAVHASRLYPVEAIRSE
ncbi:MAG: ABC transporter permease [Gemmatimonadetes bacterium]|nr:ABC transporter permease [Gemmatimonadota bacterium]